MKSGLVWQLPALALLNYESSADSIIELQEETLQMLEKMIEQVPEYTMVKKRTMYGPLYVVQEAAV